MTDANKFRLLLCGCLVLTILGFAYPVASDYLLGDMEGYYSRKLYFEKAIAPKGLPMHPARHWKKTE